MGYKLYHIIRSFARQEVTNVNEKFQNPEAIDQFMKENHWKIDPKSVNKTFNDSDDKASIKAETHLTNVEHLINYIETTDEPVDLGAVYVNNFGGNANLRLRFPSLDAFKKETHRIDKKFFYLLKQGKDEDEQERFFWCEKAAKIS